MTDDVRECGLDGCPALVRITLRPDGRYRVQHGTDSEGSTRFLTHSELYGTDGMWPFCAERHAEETGARIPTRSEMAKQAIALLDRAMTTESETAPTR